MGLSKKISCCCLVLVAMAAMFTAGDAFALRRGDICQKADYTALCRAMVKGVGNPSFAAEKAINQLILAAKRGLSGIQRRKSPVMDVCRETYDDAIDNLKTSLSNIRSKDKGSLNSNLSAALTDFGTCDDAVSEAGISSPITRTNALLAHMTSNCLYLSSLIKW